jgi:hypothetical protein
MLPESAETLRQPCALGKGKSARVLTSQVQAEKTKLLDRMDEDFAESLKDPLATVNKNLATFHELRSSARPGCELRQRPAARPNALRRRLRYLAR